MGERKFILFGCATRTWVVRMKPGNEEFVCVYDNGGLGRGGNMTMERAWSEDIPGGMDN